MIDANRETIAYSEFHRLCFARAGTISRCYQPTSSEKISKFTCTVKDVLDSAVYPVWYVDQDGAGGVDYNDPKARAVLFSEAVKRDDFRKKFLSGYDQGRGQIKSAELIVFHCNGCHRWALIDGNHRLTWLVHDNSLDAPAFVFELSGEQWPQDMPDFNVICAC